MKPYLLLAAGTPEELTELKKLQRADTEERYERAARKTADVVSDIFPVAVGAAGVAFLLGTLALVIYRSRYGDRWPNCRRFFSRPLKLTSRRDLAPHPSPLSPKAGQIPLRLRPPSSLR